MTFKTISGILPMVALAAAIAVTGVLAQQTTPKPKAGKQPGAGNMGARCQQMTAMHNQMMADMKAMDANLDQKITAMNAAKGNAKVEAMAAVVNEMVSQRKQMMAKMSSMRDQMMGHMAEHMTQSGGAGMRRSMGQCPMTKGMAQ